MDRLNYERQRFDQGAANCDISEPGLVLPSNNNMRRPSVFICLVIASFGAAINPAAAVAQDRTALGGIWVLNQSLSSVPPEIGFDVAWFSSASGGGQRSGTGGGGRGRRGSGSSGRES